MAWRDWFGLRPPVAIDDHEWSGLLRCCVLVRQLDDDAQGRLRDLCAQFLADKRFHEAGGHRLDDGQRLIIAALASLSVVHLGSGALKGWRDVIVYPGGFRDRRQHHDELTGVVTEGDVEMIGEAWEHGPVVLSWADIEEDLAQPHDGFNVVVHEIAHKLDMLDGAMNGTPELPASMSRTHWNRTMQRAYDDFAAAVDRGDDVAIDPYAAEAPEEFFAVLSEYHFSKPSLLASAMPGVASLLSQYYGPHAGLPSAVVDA